MTRVRPRCEDCIYNDNYNEDVPCGAKIGESIEYCFRPKTKHKTIEERSTERIEWIANECSPFRLERPYRIVKKALMNMAIEQKAIDIESFKKWAIDNSYIPFDFYNDTEGIEEDRVISFSDLMDYLKAMEENRV